MVWQEFDELESASEKAIAAMRKIPLAPSPEEIKESSNCRQCRSYFYRQGPVCRHCKRRDSIETYLKKVWSCKEKRTVLFSLDDG